MVNQINNTRLIKYVFVCLIISVVFCGTIIYRLQMLSEVTQNFILRYDFTNISQDENQIHPDFDFYTKPQDEIQTDITDYTTESTTNSIPDPEQAGEIFYTNNVTNLKNVLFIISDDLRPQLGIYKDLRNSPNPDTSFRIKTPNIDQLAKRSIVFTRAYSQFSVCGPSRSSFLTSRRPDTTRVYDLETYWRKAGGNFKTIPQFFKDRGYTSVGLGKVFHKGPMSNYDDPISWSEYPLHGDFETYWRKSIPKSWYEVSKTERRERPLPDEDVNRKAIERLNMFADNKNEPFFMAVGYVKPHVKYNCPKEHYKMYSVKDLNFNNYYYPSNFPDVHWYPPETGAYADNVKYNCTGVKHHLCKLPYNSILKMRRAYFACVSYVDDLLGQLLRHLDKLGLRQSTIIVFFGDHGYHLGENGMYGKHTNLEQATRVPLLMSVPGKTDGGLMSHSLVELTDLFPTVVEAAGLGTIEKCPLDSSKVELCTDGTSFMPLIENPDLEIKKAAISQMNRQTVMGYSIRTVNYRYTEWVEADYSRVNDTHLEIDCGRFWNDPVNIELYDHIKDPEENRNVAAQSVYSKVVDDHREILREEFPIEKALKYTEHILSRRGMQYSCMDNT